MKSLFILQLLLLHLSLLADDNPSVADIDKLWDGISEAVSAGDFEAYRSAHHPDAVLVINGKSQSMESAHQLFQRGFDDTAAGKVSAGIEFRWTQRSLDADTAFEKGAFHYWSEAAGNAYDQYTQFEAVLVKGEQGWVIVVQRQYKTMTKDAWDALEEVRSGE